MTKNVNTHRRGVVALLSFTGAVAMIFAAASMSTALRSASFAWAISRTCALVTDPTVSRPEVLDPFSTPAALRSMSAAGGVFVIKTNERSS